MTRTTNALAERHSRWEAAPDGMGWLHWYGTAHDTKAAYDRINSMAGNLKKAGDPAPMDLDAEVNVDAEEKKRTLDQLRADITRALLLDGITPDGMGAGIRGTVMITVPVLTLLGLDEEPATLEGYGPISPENARQIAGHAPSFTRLLTHPETGVVLSLGKTQHKNTKAMKTWLRVRDETCRFPGCSRPAVKSDVTTPKTGPAAGRPTATTSPTSANPTTDSNTSPTGRSPRNQAESCSGPPPGNAATAPTRPTRWDHPDHKHRSWVRKAGNGPRRKAT
ncbi:DUF222 domain-containing protein [Cryobacterium lactosi]|uniref:DUF222 domain-containing protein n=1 Tax=Cryobacterium lactosi TaxID=1259202 RepID=UPI001F540C65|nr:DUF222 domain-containing protein [Cryobacterium lactosi]